MSYTTWSPSYQQVPPYGMMHAQQGGVKIPKMGPGARGGVHFFNILKKNQIGIGVLNITWVSEFS